MSSKAGWARQPSRNRLKRRRTPRISISGPALEASEMADIAPWPDESREAAQLVIDAHGDPDESTESLLIWHHAGPWKRIVASKTFYRHDFPAPHIDAVES